MTDAERIRYLEESIRELRKEKENLKKEKGEMKARLVEENIKLKLHIEAKDKAYTALLKDYEEIKEDRKKILDEIEAEIERLNAFRNR